MIVVDVETTGLDPKRLSVISIGAVDFSNPDRQFYIELKPWEGATEVTKEALEVNGLDLLKLRARGQDQDVGIMSFMEFCGQDNLLAGHNVWFDRDCLREMAARANLKWYFKHHIVDTFTLGYLAAWKYGKEIPKKQADMFKLVGMEEEPKPHHALVGAKMEAEAIARFLERFCT